MQGSTIIRDCEGRPATRLPAMIAIFFFVSTSIRPASYTLADVIPADTSSTVASNESSSDDSVEAQRPFLCGRSVGNEIPSFYVRAVTGPLMNRSVCYVCRNGQRPVVMVLMRKLNPATRDLLVEIDAIVNQSRARGLRCFGVLISEEPMKDVSQVQTFAFDGKIEMPLTVGAPMVAMPSCQNMHPESELTIVLYRDRKVVANYEFLAEKLDRESIERMSHAIRRFSVE